MVWIKRNLFFVIGAVLSVALLGFAGFHTYTGWKHNSAGREELNQAYEELKRLYNQPRHPGFGKVDNIKTAREQQQEISEVLAKAAKVFQPVSAIPDTTSVTSSEFQAALHRTVDQLTREAAAASVLLPQDYKFSFFQQFRLLNFAPGSLQPLAVQLGDVKALCDVLIKAKINSIDGIQRERVSPDDYQGAQTDYIDLVSQTNDLAVLTPYQITFRSFSPEIGQVLAGFANSPHGIIVQAITVEPATAAGSEQSGAPAGAMAYAPAPAAAAPVNPPGGGGMQAEELARMRLVRGLTAFRPDQYPSLRAAPPPANAAPTAARSGPQAILNEKPLRITLLLQVVKSLPKK
jgi:hypothetical protein